MRLKIHDDGARRGAYDPLKKAPGTIACITAKRPTYRNRLMMSERTPFHPKIYDLPRPLHVAETKKQRRNSSLWI
jgi:hypothetical protein